MDTPITIGRIVHYKLTQDDAKFMNKRREDAQKNIEKVRDESIGYQLHVGNAVSEGDTVPMIVVSVVNDNESNTVNGQAFLDGNDTLWITSAPKGEDNGQWNYPPRV